VANSNTISGVVLITAPNSRVAYCSPAAAAQFGRTEREVLGLEFQELFSSPDGQLAVVVPTGASIFDAAPERVTAKCKGSSGACFELQSLRLADPGGDVCGHLHILRPVPSDEPKTASGGQAHGQLSPAGRHALHELNNVFAGILSSLELALARAGGAETKSFLLQAQTSALKGARFISDLRRHGTDLTGVEPESAIPEPRPSVKMQPAAVSPSRSLEGSERILVAEDDEAISMLIQAVLSYRGYEVVAAADGEEAVSKYREQGLFDLVILDMHMPKLNGQRTLEQIRALNPKVRALAVSGMLCDEEGTKPGWQGEFDGHLDKPFDNNELARLVRQVLDLKAAS